MSWSSAQTEFKTSISAKEPSSKSGFRSVMVESVLLLVNTDVADALLARCQSRGESLVCATGAFLCVCVGGCLKKGGRGKTVQPAREISDRASLDLWMTQSYLRE